MRAHVRRSLEGRAAIAIAGTFDTADVDQLALLARTLRAAGTPVVLDFHEVEVLSDCAIVELARELEAGQAAGFTLVGLSEHHHRILQYVGAERARRDAGLGDGRR